MALVYNDYLKSAQEAYAQSRTNALTDNDTLYASQKSALEETYNGQISDTEKAYEDNYRQNAIQKLINERQVAESMANMGLTDSGLNRTQQTAVQLSYANNKASIDKQKQSQVDALARELTASLATVEQNRLSAAADINAQYDQLISESATSAYNTDVQAETERYAAEQERLLKEYEAKLDYNLEVEKANKEASYVIRTNDGLLSNAYSGTLKDNGVDVYKNSDGSWVYIDNNSGKKTTLAAGVSPHTGTVNKDLYDENGHYDSSKAFAANGYQPNNINGVKLKEAKLKSDGSTAKYEVYGVEQTIWKANGKFYLWDKRQNKYVELSSDSTKNLF